MNKGIWIGIGLFIALAIGGGLLLSRPKVKPAQTQPMPTPTEASPSAHGEVKTLEITGQEYSFSPSSITLTKGDKVILTFRNIGRMPHNLVIDELGVATKTVLSGQSDTVEFTVNTVGTFAYYCAISNHRALGMEGSLEVK